MEDTRDFSAKLVKKICYWTDDLFSLIIEKPKGLIFLPGQYARVSMKVDNEMVTRPYSILSSPDEEFLEFYISSPNDGYGLGSSFLKNLSEGDSLFVDNNAYGYLTTNEIPSNKNLWLISSGVGIAPFISIIRDTKIFDKYDRVNLVHSVRYIEELGYKEELEKYQKKNIKLNYFPFVTRYLDNLSENISKGRVTNAIENGSLESKAGILIDKNDSHIMLCGNPLFINDTVALLEKRGMQRHRRRRAGQITLEKFW